MHQHVPELFQVLKHVRSAAPVTPCLGIPFERSLGGSNDRGVQDSVGAGDAPRKSRHSRSTKVIGDFFDSKSKSTVPPEREPVALRDLPQGGSGVRPSERGVSRQQLHILPQFDRAVHLRFDLGVEHTSSFQLGRVSPRLREYSENLQ